MIIRISPYKLLGVQQWIWNFTFFNGDPTKIRYILVKIGIEIEVVFRYYYRWKFNPCISYINASQTNNRLVIDSHGCYKKFWDKCRFQISFLRIVIFIYELHIYLVMSHKYWFLYTSSSHPMAKKNKLIHNIYIHNIRVF